MSAPWRDMVRTAQSIADLVNADDTGRELVFGATIYALGLRIGDPAPLAAAVRDEFDIGMEPAEIAAGLATRPDMTGESAKWFVAAAVAVFIPWREPIELQEAAAS